MNTLLVQLDAMRRWSHKVIEILFLDVASIGSIRMLRWLSLPFIKHIRGLWSCLSLVLYFRFCRHCYLLGTLVAVCGSNQACSSTWKSCCASAVGVIFPKVFGLSFVFTHLFDCVECFVILVPIEWALSAEKHVCLYFLYLLTHAFFFGLLFCVIIQISLDEVHILEVILLLNLFVVLVLPADSTHVVSNRLFFRIDLSLVVQIIMFLDDMPEACVIGVLVRWPETHNVISLLASNRLEKCFTFLLESESRLLQLCGTFLILEICVFLIVCWRIWFHILEGLFVFNSALLFIQWNVLVPDQFALFWKCFATVVAELFRPGFVICCGLACFRQKFWSLVGFTLLWSCSIVHSCDQVAQKLIFCDPGVCRRSDINS